MSNIACARRVVDGLHHLCSIRPRAQDAVDDEGCGAIIMPKTTDLQMADRDRLRQILMNSGQQQLPVIVTGVTAVRRGDAVAAQAHQRLSPVSSQSPASPPGVPEQMSVRASRSSRTPAPSDA